MAALFVVKIPLFIKDVEHNGSIANRILFMIMRGCRFCFALTASEVS